ncbi:glutamine synthetase family protein [Rhizobium oryzicola]|uniref:Glutamine synthetase family protein n=1 Tax=Rhizobium oryzicola TaxID=1232668 RepID=A0ABT8T3U5_9HYPH|nr:glutamine synthetase family protein [Rhizobium oryzicola]MDO1584856.1 glutamine synthetase family protein [Rhizobium oryzicola]
MKIASPSGSHFEEAEEFLARYPQVEGIDIVMTDCHGIGRGKIIRRHELASLYHSGRAMPASLFGQDVAGDDVDSSGVVLTDGGGDKRCWPIPSTLGMMPHTGRGQVLVSMYNPDGSAFDAEPRHALVRQVERAAKPGFTPMGAFELEFYLIDKERDSSRRYQPARYALNGRHSVQRNTMSVDELDEMSPLFDVIYQGAAHLGLTLESLISEYAAGQYELTIRYRDLLRAADDVVIAKRLIRSAARRFGMEACFMAKPFGQQAGSGMHLHLSLRNDVGENLYGDQPDGRLSPVMLQSIAGIRETVGDTMLVLAPFLNSWRRFASVSYSPASDDWGVENRTVALRVPGTPGKGRHFEHRVAGVDANPYMVAAVTLAGALQGIESKADPGPPVEGHLHSDARAHSSLPQSWLDAIDRAEHSSFVRQALGPMLHQAFIAVKRAEYERLALEVSEAEWDLYGFVV